MKFWLFIKKFGKILSKKTPKTKIPLALSQNDKYNKNKMLKQ